MATPSQYLDQLDPWLEALLPPGMLFYARYNGEDYQLRFDQLPAGGFAGYQTLPRLQLRALLLTGKATPGVFYRITNRLGGKLDVVVQAVSADLLSPFAALFTADDTVQAVQYNISADTTSDFAGGGGTISVSGITEFRDRFGASFAGTPQKFAETLLKKAYGPGGNIYVDNPQRQYGGSTQAVLHWSVSAGTSAISQVTVAGQLQPAGQTSGTVTTSAALNVGSSFALHVVDAGGLEYNALTYVTYANKRFYGVTSQDPLTLTDAQLSTLVRGLVGQEFSESRQQEREFDCVNQYIVFGWVASAGAGNFFLNGLANTAFQTKQFAFDNGEAGDGHTQTYRVSRNGSLITGHFSAKVS